MNWIKYLLEANLYLVLFYSAYYLLLRKDTYYQLNRIYLLGSSLLAFVIPFMQLGVLRHGPEIVEQPLAVNTTSYVIPTTQVVASTTATVTVNYYLLAYAIVAMVMLAAFLFRLFQLTRLARNGNRIVTDSFKIVEIEDEGHAFSFFNYLFIDPKLSCSTTIINHELVHIRQKHSLDIMYLELLKIICWFDPVVYLLQNSLKELHEFIADDQVASAQRDVDAYTDFLVNNAYGLPEMAIANNFFNKNLLKTRIMMLHQKRSGRLARLKYLVALPLLAVMLCLSTLGFTKDHGMLDLAPAKQIAKKAVIHTSDSVPPPPPPVPPVGKPRVAPPPPPPRITGISKTGYKYTLDGYMVKGKTDFRVLINEKNGGQKEYYRNKASEADLKLLRDTYGFEFPKIALHDKMPPPPPAPPVTAPPAKVHGPAIAAVQVVDEAASSDTTVDFSSFYNQISKNTRYPAAARSKGIQGKVFIAFNISADHKIENLQVLRSLSGDIDQELIRVLKAATTPDGMKPAIIYTIPVSFALVKEGSNEYANATYSTAPHSYIVDKRPDGKTSINLNEVVVVSYVSK